MARNCHQGTSTLILRCFCPTEKAGSGRWTRARRKRTCEVSALFGNCCSNINVLLPSHCQATDTSSTHSQTYQAVTASSGSYSGLPFLKLPTTAENWSPKTISFLRWVQMALSIVVNLSHTTLFKRGLTKQPRKLEFHEEQVTTSRPTPIDVVVHSGVGCLHLLASAGLSPG